MMRHGAGGVEIAPEMPTGRAKVERTAAVAVERALRKTAVRACASTEVQRVFECWPVFSLSPSRRIFMRWVF
jgi:hypothetical protein